MSTLKGLVALHTTETEFALGPIYSAIQPVLRYLD